VSGDILLDLPTLNERCEPDVMACAGGTLL
jgi:hypothetical protein